MKRMCKVCGETKSFGAFGTRRKTCFACAYQLGLALGSREKNRVRQGAPAYKARKNARLKVARKTPKFKAQRKLQDERRNTRKRLARIASGWVPCPPRPVWFKTTAYADAYKDNQAFDRRHRPTKAAAYRQRYATDSAFNAKEKLRASLRRTMKKANLAWTVRWNVNHDAPFSPGVEQQLGFTMREFVVDFNKKFTAGMTWEKFRAAEIEIDHIIPLAHFKSPIVVREAWGLTNLQPLWKADNAAKWMHLDWSPP